jgi:hypothetical protein
LIKKDKSGLGVKMNEIDIIFFKLTSNVILQDGAVNVSIVEGKKTTGVNSYAKIDYLTFINSIEMIANHVKDNNTLSAIDNIVKNNIIPLIKKFISKTNELSISQLEDADFVKLKKVLAKSLYPLYKVYMNRNETINFSSLFK